MSDETQQRRRYGLWIALVLAPVLYVLSFGPAIYVVKRTGTGQGAARTVYAPLVWLVAENTPLRNPLRHYVVWWDDLAGRPVPPP
jgi:hypothetical protein